MADPGGSGAGSTAVQWPDLSYLLPADREPYERIRKSVERMAQTIDRLSADLEAAQGEIEDLDQRLKAQTKRRETLVAGVLMFSADLEAARQQRMELFNETRELKAELAQARARITAQDKVIELVREEHLPAVCAVCKSLANLEAAQEPRSGD